VLVSVQTARDSGVRGAALLLLPRSGVPLSFEQIEERWPSQEGASAGEVMSSRCYRDASGRLRLEGPSYVVLIDPIAGYKILLSEQVAYRTPWPKSGEGRLVFFGAGDSLAVSRNWTTRTEDIGKRAIEGIEFSGIRVVQTSEDDSTLTKKIEQWYSDELSLIGFAVAAAPNETRTVRIRNVRREEPDPILFTIPPDYKVLDLNLP
jgi:hypothetical protein